MINRIEQENAIGITALGLDVTSARPEVTLGESYPEAACT